MPSANAKINFKAGLQSSFDKLTKDLNTVYFITDTQRFFVGETEYSRPVSYGSSLPTGYLPPNSLFVLEGTGTRDLFFSKDGASWEPIAHVNEAVLNADDKTIGVITAKAYGSATKVPVITVDSKGAITAIEEKSIAFPAETGITIGSATGSGNVIGSLTASGHTITPGMVNAVVANTAITAATSNSLVKYDEKGLVVSGVAAGSAATKDVATEAISTSANDDLVTGSQVKTYVDSAVAGLAGAMHFVGVSTTDPKGTTGATVSGHTKWSAGDVVIYGNKEFVLDKAENKAANWHELGDESIYAVKGSIVNDDIAANAAIDQSKINGLGAALNAKVDKVTDAVTGNFVSFGASGAVVDSGKKAADFATASSVTALTTRVGSAETDIDNLQAVTVAGKALSGAITISAGDLSDVNITTPAAGQGLVYDATTKTWKNSSITASSVAWTGVTGRPTSIALEGDVTGSVTLGSGANNITAAIAAGSIVNDDISDSAAISMSKISGLSTALSGKVDNTITVNGQALTANVQINDITGNAGSANKVNNALTINGNKYDGSKAITITTPDTDTTYTFVSGEDGSFSVTPSGSATAQKVLIGKPSTAGTADAVAWSGITSKPSIKVTGAVTGTLDLSAATPALSTTLRELTDADIPVGITASKISGVLTNATISGSSVTSAVASATKATQDASGNVITATYATKTELKNSALVWGTF